MQREKKPTDPFYGTAAWKKAARRAMQRDHGNCVRCAKAGRYVVDKNGRAWPVRAVLVHHIKPFKEHPELALELSNLISLCAACHDEAHPEKRARAREAVRPREVPLALRMGIRVEDFSEEGDGGR